MPWALNPYKYIDINKRSKLDTINLVFLVVYAYILNAINRYTNPASKKTNRLNKRYVYFFEKFSNTYTNNNRPKIINPALLTIMEALITPGKSINIIIIQSLSLSYLTYVF